MGTARSTGQQKRLTRFMPTGIKDNINYNSGQLPTPTSPPAALIETVELPPVRSLSPCLHKTGYVRERERERALKYFLLLGESLYLLQVTCFLSILIHAVRFWKRSTRSCCCYCCTAASAAAATCLKAKKNTEVTPCRWRRAPFI